MNVGTWSDVIGIMLFAGFGAWLAVAPENFVCLQSRFHKRMDLQNISPAAIRIVGLLWVTLVISVSIWQIHGR